MFTRKNPLCVCDLFPYCNPPITIFQYLRKLIRFFTIITLFIQHHAGLFVEPAASIAGE